MKLLVDNQLPQALCRHLRERGLTAEHVADWGLAEASDEVIWQEAKQRGFVVVSKDADFLYRADLEAGGPQVVWVRLGNCRRAPLLAAFDAVLDELLKALGEGQRVVEVR